MSPTAHVGKLALLKSDTFGGPFKLLVFVGALCARGHSSEVQVTLLKHHIQAYR